ncbi:hypothetical protein GBO34_00830 [Roseivirga pacifica]|uniref:hypothetical protein n=1 Tax=Roseivirga pacifica TaxID=1267423 RepID=UPI0020959103|nr:hypothetical protein [Roseivirga pacifica]MCO6367857.1 hypothetical protein [Roseivirga pacifica]MCO6377229.1 hypothetical protein [Roseivirga pacifica]
MISFTNETTYRTYWDNLAQVIPSLSGFKYGDGEIRSASARSNFSSEPTLWVDPLPPIKGQGQMDGITGEAISTFVVMIPSSTKHDLLEAQETKKAQCSAIVMDIFKRIKDDFQSGDIYGSEPQFGRLQFGTTDPIAIGGGTFVGCAAELPFTIPLEL